MSTRRPEPATAGGRSRLRFEPWTVRRLGIRDGMRLEARIDAGNGLQPCIVPTELGGGLLEVVAIDDLTGARRDGHCVLVPLAPGAVARWSREWVELHSPARPATGALEPMDAIQPEGSGPPVLPPLYLCTAKKVWVHVVCHGCSGRAGPADGGAFCPTCGSSGPTSGSVDPPLEALARRVRSAGPTAIDAAPGGGAAKVIPCLACDRKELCFSPHGASAAAEVLIPVSERPWGATLVEPLHLPWTAWCRLASGEPWSSVHGSLAGFPPKHLDAVAAILAERTMFHAGPGAAGFAVEALLVRLEWLRQLLEGLAALSGDLGHPHLGVRSERLWARFLPSDALRPVAWGVRFALLDLTAGWTGADGDSSDAFEPPADRPPELRPSGCAQGTGWVEGLGIARTVPGGPAVRAEFQFIPDAAFVSPPSKGSLLQIQLMDAAARGSGKVETGFPDLLRLAVDDPKRLPAEFQGLFESGKGRARVKVRVQKDHQIADDLFAAGTLWFSTLTPHPGDLAAAAGAREAALRARQRIGASASAEALAAACDTEGVFLFRSDGRVAGHNLDAEIFGRAISLGLELCGLVPKAYAGQDHEPTLRSDRAVTFERFLDVVRALAVAARPGLHGLPPADRDILLALEAYERERGR